MVFIWQEIEYTTSIGFPTCNSIMQKSLLCCWLFFLFCGHVYAQNIQINSFKATNEYQDSTYNLQKPIKLNYRETHIIISFGGLSTTKVEYEYRLLGLHQKWIPNGQGQVVNYVNLFGGSYEFQVRNARYPAQIASVKFHLEEAFWQKTWFIPMIIGYGLLIVAIVWYFFKSYKFRQQLRLQQVRNEIAADLHDDVGSTLGNIGFLGEMAQMKFDKNPADALPILNRIVEHSKEMIQTMRGMVWTINPDNDNAQDFFEKIRAFAEAMLTNRNMRLSFKNEVSEKQALSIEQQRHLFLVFKELVHNIAKHSQATEVSISIKKYQNWLWTKVTDNGVGFDTTQAAEGNGLHNLHKRMEQLQGKIEVQSACNEGTTTKLMLPLE